MKIMILAGILAGIFHFAHADTNESTPETRARLMMACDPQLASKQIALSELDFELVFEEPDFADEYTAGHTLYIDMKNCDDLKNVYQAYVEVAKKYRNNESVEEYWLTPEGQKNLNDAVKYLQEILN